MFEPNENENDIINNEELTDEVKPNFTGEFAAGGEDDTDAFARPISEDSHTRETFSDAGYVESENACAVPPVYHFHSDRTEGKTKKHGFGRIIAACLVCALLGGICGGGATGLIMRSRMSTASEAGVAPETVITTTKSEPSKITTSIVQPGNELSPKEIYDIACRQVVAISTEITTTNFFGYTSSAAVSGSGFIISPDGYILTNHHVIEDAARGGYAITVLMYDGTKYDATIVGYEADNDVAVLKIDAVDLDAAVLGDSDGLNVGDDVYAVGNPLGELEYTMTRGMISARDRELSSTDSQTGVITSINMFQIDAAVNSGNSGGPVYDDHGEVVGIVTAKYSRTGVEGLGFAIPINDAVSIATDLITNGYVTGKAYMGITAQTVSSTVAQYYNMVEGAFVYSIEPGSCAEKCGLNVGDIIVSMDDKEITSSSSLTTEKKNYKAGDSAVLKVFRNGDYIELTITFDEQTPTEKSDEANSNGWKQQR